MKKLFIFTIVLVTVTTMIACQSSGYMSSDTEISYTLEDFKEYSIKSTEAKPVVPDSCLISSEGLMELFQDSILIILEMKSENQFLHAINTKSGKMSSFLTKGRAKTEAITPWTIWCSAQDIHCYDRSGKILKCRIHPSDLTADIKKEANVDPNLTRICPIGDHHYMTAGREDRYHIIDQDGSIIKKTGVFPITVSKSGIKPDNSTCSILIKSAPNNDYIVCANLNWNKIELYNQEGELYKLLSGPINITTDIIEEEMPFGKMKFLEPLYNMFTCLTVCDNGFLVSYVGIDLKSDPQIAIKGANKILSFDKEGHPRALLKFDKNFSQFKYNEKTKELFCTIETNGNFTIIGYDLKAIPELF